METDIRSVTYRREVALSHLAAEVETCSSHHDTVIPQICFMGNMEEVCSSLCQTNGFSFAIKGTVRSVELQHRGVRHCSQAQRTFLKSSDRSVVCRFKFFW